MNYDPFFEKNDLLNFLVLQKIAGERDVTVPETVLQDSLSISTYQLHKTLETINNDLAQIQAKPICRITSPAKNMLKGNNITTTVLQKIRLRYLKRSVTFSFFKYQFFFSNLQSKADFIRQHFISRSRLYTAEAQLKTTLQQNNFYQSTGLSSTDSEYTIRLHLFQFFYMAFNGIESPFPEVDSVISHIVTNIENHLKVKITPTQWSKLSIFLKVWLLRLRNKCYIEESLFDEKNSNLAPLHDLRQIILNELKLDISELELQYLHIFLITQGYITSDQPLRFSAAVKVTDELTDELMADIAKNRIVADPAELEHLQLRQTIAEIHSQFTTFYIEPTTFISMNQIDFFKQTYPLFDIVISKFVQKLQLRTELSISQNDAVNLYFSYMFALINCIPTESMRDKIFICVDFSQGKLYTDYIVKTLDGFDNAHLIVERTPSEQTDIYLSDFSNNFVEQAQIIWRNPPTPTDWGILGDTIIQIKQTKVNKIINEHDVETE